MVSNDRISAANDPNQVLEEDEEAKLESNTMTGQWATAIKQREQEPAPMEDKDIVKESLQ